MNKTCPDCGDEGQYCDVHFAEVVREYAYLRGTPRHTVFNDAQAQEQRDAELRSAGRGHLVKP